MMRRLLLVAAVLLCASGAFAQTPTDTATPTATPTPTINPQGALARYETCGSPPCSLAAVPAGAGLKTIALRTLTGTATVVPYCRIGVGHLPVEFALGTLSGATCSTGANCGLTTSAYCDEIFLTMTACGTSCRINAWLRIDPR